jgi:hypothetical protein
MKHFKGFSSRFTDLHAKLVDAHCRQNETLSRKNTCLKTMHVHSVVSHGRLVEEAFSKVTLASPLNFFHRGS